MQVYTALEDNMLKTFNISTEEEREELFLNYPNAKLINTYNNNLIPPSDYRRLDYPIRNYLQRKKLKATKANVALAQNWYNNQKNKTAEERYIDFKDGIFGNKKVNMQKFNNLMYNLMGPDGLGGETGPFIQSKLDEFSFSTAYILDKLYNDADSANSLKEAARNVIDSQRKMKPMPSVTDEDNTGLLGYLIGVGGDLTQVASSAGVSIAAGVATGAVTANPYAALGATAVSSFLQIAPNMITSYNLDKARSLYPNANSLEEAMGNLIDADQGEILTPVGLAGIATIPEMVGIRGMGKFIMSKTGRGIFGKAAQLMYTSGTEGATEVVQLLPEAINTGLAQGKSLKEASVDAVDFVKDNALKTFISATTGSFAFSGLGRAGKGILDTTWNSNKNMRVAIDQEKMETIMTEVALLNQRRIEANSTELKEAIDEQIKDKVNELESLVVRTSSVFNFAEDRDFDQIDNIEELKKNYIRKVQDLHTKATELDPSEYQNALDLYKQKFLEAQSRIKGIVNKVSEKSVEQGEKVNKIYKNEVVEETNEERKQVGIGKIIELYRGMATRIANKRKDAPNFDLNILTDEILTGKRGVLDLIRNYEKYVTNQQKQNKPVAPLAGYINTNITRRAIEASNRVLGDDFTVDEKVLKKETVEQPQPKLKKPEAVEKITEKLILEKAVRDKIILSARKILGTRLPKLANKKDFKREIIKSLRDDLFKTFKQDVFKIDRAYKDFLADNFEQIFKNIPQATLNKRFSQVFTKKMVLPSGKPLREKTPEGDFVYGVPPISKQQWVDYFTKQPENQSSRSWNKTKSSRKGALAQVLADELGSDQIVQAIADPEVATKFKEIQELSGEELKPGFAARVIQAIDRTIEELDQFQRENLMMSLPIVPVFKGMLNIVKKLVKAGTPFIDAVEQAINSVTKKNHPTIAQQDLDLLKETFSQEADLVGLIIDPTKYKESKARVQDLLEKAQLKETKAQIKGIDNTIVKYAKDDFVLASTPFEANPNKKNAEKIIDEISKHHRLYYNDLRKIRNTEKSEYELLVYNGSPKPFNELGTRSGLIYLATNKREAKAYADQNRGNVKNIYIQKNDIASEKALISTMNELGINTTEGSIYELIDQRFEDFYIGKEAMNKLKVALAKKGFKGARYTDGAQVVAGTTESIFVFDKSVISNKKRKYSRNYYIVEGENYKNYLNKIFTTNEVTEEGEIIPYKIKKIVPSKNGSTLTIVYGSEGKKGKTFRKTVSNISSDPRIKWDESKIVKKEYIENEDKFREKSHRQSEDNRKIIFDLLEKTKNNIEKASGKEKDDLIVDAHFMITALMNGTRGLGFGMFEIGNTDPRLKKLEQDYDIKNTKFIAEHNPPRSWIRDNVIMPYILGSFKGNNQQQRAYAVSIIKGFKINLIPEVLDTKMNNEPIPSLKTNYSRSMGPTYTLGQSALKRYEETGVIPKKKPEQIIEKPKKEISEKPKVKTKVKKDTKIPISEFQSNSEVFNKFLEKVTGIDWAARIEKNEAKLLGAQKKQGIFRKVLGIPYDAEDFAGLLYATLGKGELGNQQLKFYDEKLFRPFAEGVRKYEVARQTTLDAWKKLKSSIKQYVPKGLKEINETGYSNEMSVRVYIWHTQGNVGLNKDNTTTNILNDLEIDSKKYLDHLEIVRNNPQLKAWSDKVMSLFDDGYPPPTKNWVGGGIETDILGAINDTKRAEFLAPYLENAKEIFSPENMNKLESLYGKEYVESLENALESMKTGRNRQYNKRTGFEKGLTNWITGSVGTIMFLNARSALLQLISSVNFLNLTDNNPIAAARAAANIPQYTKDMAFLFNSEFLKGRRGGLRTDINADDIARAAEESSNPLIALTSQLLKKGFVLTQVADSAAIVLGGAVFYRNRVNSLMKKGMSQKDAEAEAFLRFQELTEESQQSSRPDKLSRQQRSTLGRFILNFANTPMQYTRIIKKAILDLANGRGDRATNVSKILYYGAVQNIFFTAMQQGLFALAFDDEEDDKKKIQTDSEKYADVLEGAVTTLLRGSGMYGAVGAAGLSILRRIQKDKELGRGYDDTDQELIALSPSLSAKLRKIATIERYYSWKQYREKMDDLSMDNTHLRAAAAGLEFFNLPVERLLRKYDNISAALDRDLELNKRIALSLGWSKWSLNIKDEKPKKPFLRKKRRKKIRR
mgnify:CR=1 FL=1